MITGQLVSLSTAFLWAISVVIFEYTGKKLGAHVVNTIRLIYGFFIIGMILWISTGSFIAQASERAWIFISISAILGFLVGDFFLFQAFLDIGGRLTLLVYSVTPVIGAIIDFFVFKEVLGLFTILGMMLTFIGIYLAIYSRGNEKVKKDHLKRGIIFALLGAFGQATGLIFSKLALSEGLSAFEITQLRILVGLIGFLIVLTFQKKLRQLPQSFRYKKASILLFIGSITGPILGIWTTIYAMQFAPIGVTTTIAQLNTILIIPLSVVIFKEKIAVKEIIAACIAFIGVALLFI
jgi:drug/metabolite transporter (DMT)-like permease